MAEEFHAALCSPMSWPWIATPQPPSTSCCNFFSPQELNQVQTYGFMDSSMSDPGLFDPMFDPLKDMINDPWATNNDMLSTSTTQHDISRVSSPPSILSKQHLNFTNNTPFWNPSANNPSPRFHDESLKSSEAKRHGSSSDNHQPAAKKARIATPSPLPTFKVRKEKLGDRITALQQLVSPFGKTDTASVLHEAIEYIKFLHGQVGALSSPYLKNGSHQMQHQLESSNDGGGQELRSRGLCLVPISSTFAVASEMPMEFWAPTFLGGYM